VPLIQFTTATPLNGPLAGRTTGTVNPGVIWVNRNLKAGVEAIIPMDAHPGRDLGARAGPFGIFPQSLPIRRADVRELSARTAFFFGFWLLLVAIMETASRRWYIGIWQMVRSYW